MRTPLFTIGEEVSGLCHGAPAMYAQTRDGLPIMLRIRKSYVPGWMPTMEIEVAEAAAVTRVQDPVLLLYSTA